MSKAASSGESQHAGPTGEDIPEIIGRDIKRAREERGLSQQALADLVGISQPALRKIENGDTRRSKYLPDIYYHLSLGPPPIGDDFKGLRQNKFPMHNMSLNDSVHHPGKGFRSELPNDINVYTYNEEAEITFVQMWSKYRIARNDMFPKEISPFAVAVMTEAMIPAFFPTQSLILSENIKPAKKAHAMLAGVEADKYMHALIRYIEDFDEEYWHVKAWNAEKAVIKETRLPRDEWPKCYMVIGLYCPP